MTKQIRTGLIISALLGVSDFLILLSISDKNGPPNAIIVVSIIIGLGTLVSVAKLWGTLTRSWMISLFAFRIVDGIGDVLGLFQGVGWFIWSAVLLALTAWSLNSLRGTLSRTSLTA